MNLPAPKLSQLGGKLKREEAGKAAQEYTEYFEASDATSRTGKYTEVVNKYYDLATSFYEYGWYAYRDKLRFLFLGSSLKQPFFLHHRGESFHFAHRYAWETLKESLKRHEHFLALKLGLSKSDKVIDAHCPVTVGEIYQG